MRLMTAKLEKRFAQVGSQDVKDPVVVAKFFNPAGAKTWYATEYDAALKRFIGYVSVDGEFEDGWDYFFLEELESYRSPWGTEIECDLYWTERKISSVIH